MMKTIHIAIADDEALFRKGMSFLIEDFGGMQLLFEAADGAALLKQLAQANPLPDIVLLDLKMPNLNGIETAKQLVEDYPSIKIIILSTYFSESFIFNMTEIGAAAYLAKNTPPEEVEKTIREVFDKGFYYSHEVLKVIRDNIMEKKRSKKPSFGAQLTKREKEILQLICEQNTNAEIAKKLFISTRTVDGHRNNLLQKLNCRNTAGLVAYAIQEELVRIDPSQFWV